MRWRNRSWLLNELQRKPEGSAAEGLSRYDAETLAVWTEAARERGPVLFVGAGWPLNALAAPRADGQTSAGEPRALNWDELAHQLREGLETDNQRSSDPLWLAELYRQRFGADALMTLIRHAVPDDQLRPGPLFDALRAVPWRAILTTNYDSLLERTFAPNQRVQVCADDIDLVRSSTHDALEIVHLHGVLQRPQTVVLAYEDFRLYPQTRPGLLAKVRQLFLQHPVLFVGYGITDPNFLLWSGWLADIVGEYKNPWVNIYFDKRPSLSHARYWGTRLEFVAFDNNSSRFKAVVPHLLRVIGEALDPEDRRSSEVAMRRLGGTRTVEETVREVRELLATGDKRGAEGDEWDYFRRTVFNLGASRVLDLKGVAWRDAPPDAQEANTGFRIEIEMRPLHLREFDTELLHQLTGAFDAHWGAWLSLLCEHMTVAWQFDRVDPEQRRSVDNWNRTLVHLDGARSVDTDPQEPLKGGPEAPSAPGSEARLTPGQQLDLLRAGAKLDIPSAPQRPDEFRMVGYLAFQRGDVEASAEAYREAVAASREAREPLRVEWLTLRSQLASLDLLDRLSFRDNAIRLKRDQEQIRGALNKVRSRLVRLPRDEGAESLQDVEIGAHEKMVRLLVDDLGRHDIDRTMRFGHVYGDADHWLTRLERHWLAPSILAPAADALGTLQWRFGDWVDAARTLARYGSERLAKLVAASTADANLDPSTIPSLIAELLRGGRWPGEWLARSEALQSVLSSCSASDLAAVEQFANDAQAAFGEEAYVLRGSSSVPIWIARSSVEHLEVSRWRWLPPTGRVKVVVG